jgi:hypothetical protein
VCKSLVTELPSFAGWELRCERCRKAVGGMAKHATPKSRMARVTKNNEIVFSAR